jgi:flavin reductase (DIM6/NTAB) family NADH-FMN oxidoreductase RutF
MTEAPFTFDPAAEDPRAFRNALGQFTTGVTVVTCGTPTGPIGITANSFSSLSLDPPLVLWSPAKGSSRYPFYVAASHFAIHVLAADQIDLCNGFARSGNAFDTADWHESPQGVPLLNGCLARFECENTAQYDGGDHTIVVGKVHQVTTQPGQPLLFASGQYGLFAPTV